MKYCIEQLQGVAFVPRNLTRLLLFALPLLVYRLALDWSYQYVVYALYAYTGFESQSTSFSLLLSWSLLLISTPLAWVAFDNAKEKLSYILLFLLYLMSFVPFTSMVGFGVISIEHLICNCVFWLLLFCLTLCPLGKPKRFLFLRSERAILGETEIELLAILLMAVVLYISGRYTHFRLNFSLSNVYDLRAEASAFQLPTILSYLYAWSQTVNAVLISYFMVKRRYGWAVFCVVVQLLSFGIDGSKTVLFLAIAAVAVGFLPRLRLRNINVWLMAVLTVLTIGCILLYTMFSSIYPISLFVRRTLFLPVEIGRKYFDFFTTHTPDYYRQSFLRLFGAQSPYETLPRMIAHVYYNVESHMNNGLLSDAVANLGYIGVFIGPMIYAVVFRALDLVSERVDPRIHITVAVYSTVMMINSFLFPILLTHGLFVTILLLLLIGQEREKVMPVISWKERPKGHLCIAEKG
ncbi:MAG: hypothetical protein IJ138_10110 [Clostridia bacterium]|nr:hypothetical protein [Clostridia bacterium]